MPVIVKLNDWPATGGFGVVAIELKTGPPPLAPDTVSAKLFEAVPLEPFCTVTVKLPALASVVEPLNCIAVLVSALLAIVHGVHPGPVNETKAVAGSKPVPLIVKLNDCPATGGFGLVVIVVT